MYSAFQVAINKAQACALKKASCRAPTPEEQLALLREKQGKQQRVILSLIILICSVIYIVCMRAHVLSSHQWGMLISKEV